MAGLRAAAYLVSFLLGASPVTSTELSDYWDHHFDARMAIISAQTSLLGTNNVLLLGDSNTEMFWWNQNSGCYLVNAGFAGARIHDIAQYADQIATLTAPKIVHVMVGTNNVYGALKTDPDVAAEWPLMEADMHTIIQAFKSRGSKVVVWPIPPFAAGFGDNADRVYINGLWKTVIDAEGGAPSNVYWDWWWPNQITQGTNVAPNVTNGYAASGALMNDGVHLSPSSQVSRFYRIETWKTTISP